MNDVSTNKKVSYRWPALSAAIFLIVAVFQLYWATGGSWGLAAAWGGTYTELPSNLQVGSAISAVIMVFGAITVMGRAGYKSLPIPFGVFRWGIWVFVAMMTLSALANFASSSNWEQFLNGPIALIQVVLCITIARSAKS